MSESFELVRALSPDTLNDLYSQSKMFSEKPQLVMKWHVCISSPALGLQSYSYDDFDTMRREVSKVSSKLSMGAIHVFYGYAMPITSDRSGQNLFTVDQEGNEVSLTEGWNDRTPVNKGTFGVTPETIDITNLI